MSHVILIGGTSHTGKSTLADRIAAELGFSVLSTDRLSRHPGRPWPAANKVPDHVATHYASLAADELTADVLRHYRRQRPHLVALIRYQQSLNAEDRDSGLCLEGSCLWPSSYANLGCDGIWLTLPESQLRQRIRRSSQIESLPADGQKLVNAFIDRSLHFQQLLIKDAEQCGMTLVDAASLSLFEQTLTALGKNLA